MATTSTFGLRRLIQTKLSSDDDTPDDDTASCYQDDLRNPIKRRLTAWLIPDQPDHPLRRGSAPSAVQGRNSADLVRTPSTATPAPHIISDYQQLPHASSDVADIMSIANDGTLAGTDTGLTGGLGTELHNPHNHHASHYYDRNYHQNPTPVLQRGARRLVRMPSFSSNFSSSSLDSDHHHHQGHLHSTSNNGDSVEDDAQPPTQLPETSMTFLFAPTPSHLSGHEDLGSLGLSDQPTNMDGHSFSKDWSDGVRQLMLETEQAFASGSAFDDISTSFELRLPSASEPKAPQAAQEEADDREQDDDEEEEQHDIEEQEAKGVTFSQPRLDLDSESETEPPPAKTTSTPDPVVESPPVVSISPPPPPAIGEVTAPSSPPRSVWRKPREETVEERRSMESKDEVAAARRSRQDEEGLHSEKRKSSSVPPPLPPRRYSLAPNTDDSKQPKTPPPATSFNVTPAINNSHSPSGRTPAPQQPSRPIPNSSSSSQLAPPSKFSTSGPRRPSKITRWGLSEGVADILTGQRFKKIEADEMLTPEQLVKLKKEREEIRRKEQIESSRAAEVKRLAELERQAEKSSSESERSRTRANGYNRNSDSSTHTSPSPVPPPKDKRRSEERPPVPPKQYSIDDIGDADDENDEDLMTGLATVDLLGSPSPMDISTFTDGSPIPPRPGSPPPAAKLPPLPRGASRNSSGKRRKPTTSLLPEEDDEYFYFKSTPYSLTSPTFRHGPIAFAKSEVGRGALTMDDTLDWTAFQMAILGAGDIVPEVYDEEDPRFSDDVIGWFNTFGFDSHGQLVPESVPSPRSSSHSTVSTAPTEASIPAPALGEPASLWASSALKGEMYDTTKFFNNNGRKRWTMKGKSTEPIDDERSNSPPPMSPMMPIVVGAEDDDDGTTSSRRPVTGDSDVDENDIEMGCNLNNLGDFLKWEAQHAIGPGYYGAH